MNDFVVGSLVDLAWFAPMLLVYGYGLKLARKFDGEPGPARLLRLACITLFVGDCFGLLMHRYLSFRLMESGWRIQDHLGLIWVPRIVGLGTDAAGIVLLMRAAVVNRLGRDDSSPMTWGEFVVFTSRLREEGAFKPPGGPDPESLSPEESLADLQALQAAGALSEEEFRQRRQGILDKL